MDISQIETIIPKTFVLANHPITTEISEEVFDKEGCPLYGDWDDVRLKIRVASKITRNKESIDLSEEQIRNSFYHELTHAFLFFLGMDQDEMVAQGFANLLREYEASKC